MTRILEKTIRAVAVTTGVAGLVALWMFDIELSQAAHHEEKKPAATKQTAQQNSDSLSEEITGVVRNVGSALSARTVLKVEGQSAGKRLCKGKTTQSISRLSGMTVKIAGEWKLSKKGRKRCVIPASFQVEKTTSGRKAVVGVLNKNRDGSFRVVQDDGQDLALAEVPSGLQSLVGKKVILDVKNLRNPTQLTSQSSGSSSGTKVVSFSVFPQ